MTDRFEPKEEEIDADDYRAFFDSQILRVWHLQGKQRLFRIHRVTKFTSEMFAGGKRKITSQPKLELTTRDGVVVPLPFLLNKVNAKTIAQLYGRRTRDWVGKWIQLYPTTTERGDETVDCIRVRNQVPGADRQRRTNKQGANVLPPGVRDSDDAAYMARDNQRAEQEEIGAPRVPPSQPAPLDHERATRNQPGDDDTLEAEYEVIQ